MNLTSNEFLSSTRQVLRFLGRLRSALESPNQDISEYVVANKTGLHIAKMLSKSLRNLQKAESASVAASKHSKEIKTLYDKRENSFA